MDLIKGVIKNVILSRSGLVSIAFIVGGVFAAELAENKIADPMGREIVGFAMLMLSLAGTSMLLHQIAEYNRYVEMEKEKQKQNEKK